jgi:hypothetical protein
MNNPHRPTHTQIKKVFLCLLAVIVTLLCSPIVLEAQTEGCSAELKSMARSLSRFAVRANCQGDFTIKERFGNDATLYDVSYVVKGRPVFRQTFKSSIEQYVSLVPIKISGCSALFVRYAQGAAGRYNDSNLVFQLGNRFSCHYLGGFYDGGYNAQDLDSDGESEIIQAERQDSACKGGLCEGCYPHWSRIFHFDPQSKQLIEQAGENYPKYYASEADNLRAGYEVIKNDRNVSSACKQYFLQLIRKADRLAQGRR